jgi:hypothetical protein
MGPASLALDIGVFYDFLYSVLRLSASLGLDFSGRALSRSQALRPGLPCDVGLARGLRRLRARAPPRRPLPLPRPLPAAGLVPARRAMRGVRRLVVHGVPAAAWRRSGLPWGG